AGARPDGRPRSAPMSARHHPMRKAFPENGGERHKAQGTGHKALERRSPGRLETCQGCLFNAVSDVSSTLGKPGAAGGFRSFPLWGEVDERAPGGRERVG